MKKVIIQALILKLADGTYYQTAMVSDPKRYAIGTRLFIEGTNGIVVGYGLQRHLVSVSE